MSAVTPPAPPSVTLLPCPFCGGEARLWPVIMPFDADCDSITVQCSECDVIGADVLVDQDVHCASDLADLEAEAITAWNTRTTAEAASAARVAELVEALRSVQAALRAYLPPEGITKDECLSRILAATDNPQINAAMARHKE